MITSNHLKDLLYRRIGFLGVWSARLAMLILAGSIGEAGAAAVTSLDLTDSDESTVERRQEVWFADGSKQPAGAAKKESRARLPLIKLSSFLGLEPHFTVELLCAAKSETAVSSFRSTVQARAPPVALS
jgi:hypothetical protein